MTVHVYPKSEESAHNLEGTMCGCGPELMDEGLDVLGKAAVVVVHRPALN